MNIEPLKKAIEFCAGISAMSIKVNEKSNVISMWLQRKKIPSEKVILVSQATNYQVTPHELRPDLYPHPQDGLPEHLRTAA